MSKTSIRTVATAIRNAANQRRQSDLAQYLLGRAIADTLEIKAESKEDALVIADYYLALLLAKDADTTEKMLYMIEAWFIRHSTYDSIGMMPNVPGKIIPIPTAEPYENIGTWNETP